MVPKIRFSMFMKSWELYKLTDRVMLYSGLTYSPNDISKCGIRVLRSSNINEDSFVTYQDDVFVNIDAINIPYAQNGEIIITSANGSPRLVGKHAIVVNLTDNSAVAGGFMLIGKSEYSEFMNASMSSNWYRTFLGIHVAGGNGAIGNLNKNELDKYEFLVPNNNEKKKIGTLFSNLDNLITLHQRK